MAHPIHNPSDERLNELSDRDSLWGPLISFRPEKNRCIGAARALMLATTVGTFYGMLLNVVLVLLCRICRHHAPSVYGVPMVLTFTYFVGFQLTLGPAWNRRARLMVRRADYMQSIGRTTNVTR